MPLFRTKGGAQDLKNVVSFKYTTELLTSLPITTEHLRYYYLVMWTIANFPGEPLIFFFRPKYIFKIKPHVLHNF